MKTIGLVVHSLEGGGTQKVVTTLATFWQEQSLAKVLVFFYSGDERLYSFDTIKLDKDFLPEQISSYLQTEDIVLDGLFMHSYDGYKALIQLKSDRILKLFSCIHADYFSLYYRWYLPFKNLERTFKYRKLLNQQNVIFNSKGVASNLIEKIGLKPESSYVIPPPIEMQSILDQSSQALSIDLPSQYFVVVSRLSENKQIHLAFEALCSFSEKIHLVVLGEGPDLERLKNRVVQLGLCKRVHFLGWIANPYPIIRQSKFMGVFSRSEGFSIVIAEAMALGVIPLALRSAGPISILESTFPELLLAKNDLSILGHKFQELNLEKYPSRLKHYARQYDIHIVADQYLQLV